MENLMQTILEPQTTEFRVDNDRKADWALERIAEAESERDRLLALAQQEIDELKAEMEKIAEKYDRDTGYLKACLKEYFATVDSKETKTQATYKLLHGSLVWKKPKQKINHDDAELLKALAGTEYIETKESVKWGEYKKNLTIQDGQVIDTTTGELVTGCSVEDEPGEFSVKVG